MLRGGPGFAAADFSASGDVISGGAVLFSGGVAGDSAAGSCRLGRVLGHAGGRCVSLVALDRRRFHAMSSGHGGAGAGSRGGAHNGARHRNAIQRRGIAGQFRLFQLFFHRHDALRQQVYRHQRNRHATAQAEQQPQKQQQERQQQQPPPATPPSDEQPPARRAQLQARFDHRWQRKRGRNLIEAVQGIAIARYRHARNPKRSAPVCLAPGRRNSRRGNE